MKENQSPYSSTPLPDIFIAFPESPYPIDSSKSTTNFSKNLS